MSVTQSKKSLSSILSRSQGYFKSPDCIFDLPLSKNAKFICLYLCRRADRDGLSFPSLQRIGKDCSIKSKTTVEKAVKELVKAGLVFKIPLKGKSNTYRLSEQILSIVRPSGREDQEKNPEQEYKPSELNSPPCQNLNYTSSFFEPQPCQNLNPKEYPLKEYPFKEYGNGNHLNVISLKENEKETVQPHITEKGDINNSGPEWVNNTSKKGGLGEELKTFEGSWPEVAQETLRFSKEIRESLLKDFPNNYDRVETSKREIYLESELTPKQAAHEKALLDKVTVKNIEKFGNAFYEN